MKLNELLGIEFPIIQGGMANIATGAFAAAVSNAGALGLVASGGMDAEALRAEIRAAKANTGKPFGVNLMLMNPHIDALAKVVAEEGVQVVTTGAGNPGKYVPAWKEAGIKVFPVVAAPILAKRLERYGIDGIIAEGCESGGHIGELTTMALVPQVVDAVSVPVIAAGGIADGRQLTAAFALGACGVQVGTCLLASEECPIHANYKQAVLKAGATTPPSPAAPPERRCGCSRTRWPGNICAWRRRMSPWRRWSSSPWAPCGRPCSTATWTAAASWPARWPVWCTRSVPCGRSLRS